MTMCGHWEETAIYTPGREASGGASLSSGFQPPGLQEKGHLLFKSPRL